jgi:hypothetical protein
VEFSPAFVPVLSAAGMGVLAILVMIGQLWGQKRGKAAASTSETKDVMIPNVSVADSLLIREQIKTLRESNEHSDERRLFERQALDIFKEQLIMMRQCTAYLEEMKHHLRRIEENQPPPLEPRTRR